MTRVRSLGGRLRLLRRFTVVDQAAAALQVRVPHIGVVVQRRLRELALLRFDARPLDTEAVGGQAQPGEAFRYGGPAVRQFINAGDEIEVFLDGEVFVEREFLRHVADVRAHGFGFAVRCGLEAATGEVIAEAVTASSKNIS